MFTWCAELFYRWLKAVNEHGVCLVRGCVPEIDTATQVWSLCDFHLLTYENLTSLLLDG